MTRRTVVVVVPEGRAYDRDKEKKFFLTELSATASEEWGERALLAIMNGGRVNIGKLQGAGMAGFAALGIQALEGLTWSELKPLLDEMFACIQVMPSVDASVKRALIEDDIEEVATRLYLRRKVLELHTSFFIDDRLRAQWQEVIKMVGALITSTSPAA